MQCQPDDVAANISLGLNSISLFPPTCSVVAEYKCPNTTLHYFSLFCFFLQGKFSLLMLVQSAHKIIRRENLLTSTYIVHGQKKKPASDLKCGFLAFYPTGLCCAP